MGFVPLIQAGHPHIHDIAMCIAEAFQPSALARWLVPDRGQRGLVLYANARAHLADAVTRGQVWTTLNTSAAAVWFPPGTEAAPADADHADRLAAARGRYADRFRLLDVHLLGHRPDAAHHRLAFLAVSPRRQRAGIGSALLEEYHLRLDDAGAAAYLTATTVDFRRLCLRHGYVDLGPPADLPDGPRIWPMWRPPRADRRFPPRV